MYFIQGVVEPTEGLIAQPVRSLLKSWGHSTTSIATFGALLSLPWSLKPIYGLLTDFVPLGRTRRRSYLLLTSGSTALGLAYLYWRPPTAEGPWMLLALLLLPTVGVAFSDVVVDALMVERGQPHGLTGLLQSVQWSSMYAATILAGLVGGYLSQRGDQNFAFLIGAALTSITFLLTWWCVTEPPQRAERGDLKTAIGALASATKAPQVRAAAAFVFLWSFNPFSTAVLYMHMTEEIGLSEQFYGTSVSLLSLGAIAASIAYGFYCRRISFGVLIHGAIACGIVSTLAYGGLSGERSAAGISLGVGFAYMTGSLVLFDVSARSCPLQAAGTTFALLMGLSNFGFSLSAALGGYFYETWSRWWSASSAFNLLVLVGALANCLCFPLAPYLIRSLAEADPEKVGSGRRRS